MNRSKFQVVQFKGSRLSGRAGAPRYGQKYAHRLRPETPELEGRLLQATFTVSNTSES